MGNGKGKGAHAVVDDVDGGPPSAKLIEIPVNYVRKRSRSVLVLASRWHLHEAEAEKVAVARVSGHGNFLAMRGAR